MKRGPRSQEDSFTQTGRHRETKRGPESAASSTRCARHLWEQHGGGQDGELGSRGSADPSQAQGPACGKATAWARLLRQPWCGVLLEVEHAQMLGAELDAPGEATPRRG